MIDLRVAAGIATTIIILAGCQKGPAAGQPTSGTCNRTAAESLAGKDRLADDEVKRLTGATIVRQHKPGDPATMDFRQERVTVETDPVTGKIVRAFCG
ncbi:peptidase inhibitor I78 family protein [Aminobacter aminovorans]|uniref:Peptidase inhibitor I78 family n=1 Tax=Aminobacter aminovorans TaxID=83263 RepID=A0A380WSJ7_AMIAI|nr:I78 family peptidase inhibitor [Aminobacter aminovorans]TCS30503.1 peptidase inhibitor I78 family protein [Aminobacter aminovorans]SUU91352.1 Peptidase inhibitor I78 family [Aminobacter aminovorans]